MILSTAVYVTKHSRKPGYSWCMSGTIRFATFLGSLACAYAQAPGTGTMSGRVLDAVTGEPVRKVSVQGYLGADYATSITNDRGEFRLEGLPAGSFRVLASKPGYINSAYGTERNTQPGTYVKLVAGEQKPNVDFRLTRRARFREPCSTRRAILWGAFASPYGGTFGDAADDNFSPSRKLLPTSAASTVCFTCHRGAMCLRLRPRLAWA